MKSVYSRTYEDSKKFTVCFDKDSPFGVVHNLLYEFKVPVRQDNQVVGSFTFCQIDIEAIYKYLKLNNLIRDRLHDLLIDGDRLYEDNRLNRYIPDFTIDIWNSRSKRKSKRRDPMELNDLEIYTISGPTKIIGVRLNDLTIPSIEIDTPYTFNAKTVLFLADDLDDLGDIDDREYVF